MDHERGAWRKGESRKGGCHKFGRGAIGWQLGGIREAKAREAIDQIVPDIRKTAGLVSEIAARSKEQSIGAKQIDQSMNQINNSVQSGAASSEELAATASALNDAAVQMEQLLGFFKLSED